MLPSGKCGRKLSCGASTTKGTCSIHINNHYYFSDYFFESMILLKHTFCWDWIDVLYFVTNQRVDHKELSEDLTRKIIEWNNIDQRIFEKSNSTFWSRYNEIPNLQLLEDEFRNEIGKALWSVT